MATLVMICGLPGSGKTTVARNLAQGRKMLWLNSDEWIARLFGTDLSETQSDVYHQRVEAAQWELALKVLALGIDVVIDWGVWSRHERDKYRFEAQHVGATFELLFLDVPLEELWARLSKRNADLPPATFRVEREQLERWSKLFEAPRPDELSDANAHTH